MLHEERHVLDASALLRMYLADGPLPERLEAVMERGCRGEGSTVLKLSQEQRISVYDATYLAWALRYGAILLTADQQLAGAAERIGCGG